MLTTPTPYRLRQDGGKSQVFASDDRGFIGIIRETGHHNSWLARNRSNIVVARGLPSQDAAARFLLDPQPFVLQYPNTLGGARPVRLPDGTLVGSVFDTRCDRSDWNFIQWSWTPAGGSTSRERYPTAEGAAQAMLEAIS